MIFKMGKIWRLGLEVGGWKLQGGTLIFMIFRMGKIWRLGLEVGSLKLQEGNADFYDELRLFEV